MVMVSCFECGTKFERTVKNRKLCGDVCKRVLEILHSNIRLGKVDQSVLDEKTHAFERANGGPDLRRAHANAVRRLEAAISGVHRAESKLEVVRRDVGPDVVNEVEIDRILDSAIGEFQRKASSIAENVMANRAAAFVEWMGVRLDDEIAQYAYMRGLTIHDAGEIKRVLKGEPKPIVIEPERAAPPADFLLDEDDSEDEDFETDAEIELEAA